MVVGVLALQGDFSAHAKALRRAGASVRDVRRVQELDGLGGVVLPGGESTTLLRLMDDDGWPEALRQFHRRGGALFGTCAGAILLARAVRNPVQPSLGLLDAVVARNSYGRQVDSFATRLDVPALGRAIDAVFIRAPRFEALGPRVEVLARLGDQPVLVLEGRVMAATFHTELTDDVGLHGLFTSLLAPSTNEPLEAR